MLPVLSVALMRESDRAAIEGGIPSRELMRRAAEGIFHAASWKEPVAVVCGSGNNAGDGYALALLLKEAGIGCAVYRVSPRVSEDGAYYLEGKVHAKRPEVLIVVLCLFRFCRALTKLFQ